MGNSVDWHALPPWELAQLSRSRLAYLLMDSQTKYFHTWLFDVLVNLKLYKEAAKAIQADGKAEILDALVNQCRDLDPKKKDEEKTIREYRKKVLIILFRKMDSHWLAGLADLEGHEMDWWLLKRFREELRKGWRKGRREEREEKREVEEQKDELADGKMTTTTSPLNLTSK